MDNGPDSADHQNEETRLGGFDRGERTVVLGLFGVGGALLVLAIPFIARWAMDMPWVPFQGPLRLIASFDAPWFTWPFIGLALGLVVALFVFHATPVLHVSEQEIRVERRGRIDRVIRRDQVDGIHREGSDIVIENPQGRRLFSGEVEGDKEEVRDVMVQHGYPWESG